MSVKELRARIAKMGEERTTMQKAWVDDDKNEREPTEDEFAAFEKNIDDTEALTKRLKAAIRAEALDAESADPAPAATPADGTEEKGVDGVRAVPAEPAKPLTPGQKLAAATWGRAKMAQSLRAGVPMTMDNALGQIGISPAALRVKTLNTGADASGGVTVPQDLASEIIPFLRPASVILRGNPRTVPMPHGSMDIAAGASGAVAGYVGEGEAKPVTEPTFRKVSLKGKKLAAIVSITDELLEFSDPSVLGYVEEDLRGAMANTMDLNFLRSDGTSPTPKGLRQIAIDDGTTVPVPGASTYAAINSHLGQMELKMLERNLQMIRCAWVMSPRTLIFLTDMLNDQGLPSYPSLQGERPTLRGKPVYTTTQVPANLGGGGNESELYLIDYDTVMIGDAMSMRLATSNEATVDVGGGTLVSAFQNNVTFIRAEVIHDIAVRQVGGIIYSSGVTWGAA